MTGLLVQCFKGANPLSSCETRDEAKAWKVGRRSPIGPFPCDNPSPLHPAYADRLLSLTLLKQLLRRALALAAN